MPDHPSVQIQRPIPVLDANSEQPQSTAFLLRVTRPKITRCPPPTDMVLSWLLPGWDDPSRQAEYVESQNSVNENGETVTIRFDHEASRRSDFDSWVERRRAWVGPEIIARNALRFFERFYDLYSTIEKDGEQLELLAADGHLNWKTISTVEGPVTISHPILLKRVELRFDPNVPEFSIHETDHVAQVYDALFVDLGDIAPQALLSRKQDLEKCNYHPWGWQDTDAYLKSLIQSVSPKSGEYLDEPLGDGPFDTPRLWRDPILVLRKRTGGIANAVDCILESIETREVFPPALAQITGTDEKWKVAGLGSASQAPAESRAGNDSDKPAITDDDILLAKEANEEQLQIIRRLDRSGSVIVQGPPGTGKTHTIANLIGHLLAQGKSILVTAQTAKALRVLRDQVPEPLRPLCVSVLGSDQDARRQLETSIGSITERLTSESSESLIQKSAFLDTERKRLTTISKGLKHTLREALENEYAEIAVGNDSYTPSDAARFVTANRQLHGWIPGQVKLGVPLSLTVAELKRLYALGPVFSKAEEGDARLPLPDLTTFPTEQEFKVLASEYQQLLTTNLSPGAKFWAKGSGSSSEIETLIASVEREFSDDLRRQAWRPYAIVAGLHGGAEKLVWENLVNNIEKAVEANARYSLVIHHRPQLAPSMSWRIQLQITQEITGHLNSGGGLGFIQLVTRSEWRQYLKATSVAAGRPSHSDHFAAIGCLAQLEICRSELEDHWNSLIGRHTNQSFKSFGDSPELACRALISEIKRCLEWHLTTWQSLSSELISAGLKLDDLCNSLPREANVISEYLFTEQLATRVLPPALGLERNRRKLREIEAWFDQLSLLSTQIDPTTPNAGCVGMLLAAVKARDTTAYANALGYTRRLQSVRPLVIERDELLRKLRFTAPDWAAAISRRESGHNSDHLPGEAPSAWVWIQLHNTLKYRDRLDADEIQQKLDRSRAHLRGLTQQLIDSRAWGRQLERLQSNNSLRQALVGWMDTTRRLFSTRRHDRRQQLLSEARQLMKRSAEAVPVWIMPIAMTAESFDPRSTQFDVVIIDEASQADLNALIPLYMGKQVVFVGDHEQVTPLGVGQDQTVLDNLRSMMLMDIPNSHLFDNMASIYDIGRQSFGDAIRLVEHFRCVPEIIAFSNALSYEGKIRPLRESNSTQVKPPCVPYRVEGIREGDVNQIEAEAIVSLIKAMINHPGYADKTIGVISLLKEQQAILIQSMIHKDIDSVEIEKRRILAGISAEFQGDERDVMFLSMVDSAEEEGLLRTTGVGAFEQTKKRYNVAASRARDQLWVVHSFDPGLHLNTHDLRHRLLHHCKDPLATLRLYEQEVGKTESPFERDVLKRLIAAGFRVKTQWQVGYFRIDMVVEGAGKRLAIECDGDHYHPLEKMADDMARQAVLERLGWQFARVRGSSFYRDPDASIKRIFDRLSELEIPPESAANTMNHAPQTLVHELENIAKNVHGHNGRSLPEGHCAKASTELRGTAEAGNKIVDDQYRRPDDIAKKILDVLAQLGGSAKLAPFLQTFTSRYGQEFSGRDIHREINEALLKLRRCRKILIKTGAIWLP